MEEFNTSIIQWNLNGFYKKVNDLKLIIQDFSPKIICLQETNITDNYQYPKLPNYNSYYKNRVDYKRSSGGVAIFVDSAFPSSPLSINSNLEVVAASVLIDTKISICNVYLPNHTEFSIEDINNIINQLPSPFIITGDFNSHNELWGSKKN